MLATISLEMHLCIILLGVLQVLAFLTPAKARIPDHRGTILTVIVFWFLSAWVVSVFGSYVLQPYGVEIGYWQAFFAHVAWQFFTGRVKPDKWTELKACIDVNKEAMRFAKNDIDEDD